MIGVGDKVVCVNAASIFGHVWVGDVPVEGRVYTVSAVVPSRVLLGETALLLEEIQNSIHGDPLDEDWGYLTCRFRPVRKTDISIFQEIDRKVFGKVSA